MAEPEAQNQIVVYQPNETVRLDVRLENETVWLTQLKIAELFGVQKAAISKHVKNKTYLLLVNSLGTQQFPNWKQFKRKVVARLFAHRSFSI